MKKERIDLKGLFFLFMWLPYVAFSQHSGISFDDSLSWEQLLLKAKAENKYVFVDCYTTWCGPCKKMETEIFSKDSIGLLVNQRFLSFRLQMDSTKHDNDKVQSRYGTAQDFLTKYKVVAYPTYLFFSPDGKLVHRGLGIKDEIEFPSMISDATNPDRQYYTLLEKFKNNLATKSDIVHLIDISKSLSDATQLNEIGVVYADKYLVTLSKQELLTENNIAMLAQFTRSSKQKGFAFFHDNSAAIDSIMGKWYSARFFDKIILGEELLPSIQYAKEHGTTPPWEKMAHTITSKYGSHYADRTISKCKVSWYAYTKDWNNYTKWIILSIDKFGLDDDKQNWWYINNEAWEVFLHSNKKSELETALKWLENLMHNPEDNQSKNSNVIDTYANILYKLGRSGEALKWEQKGAELAPLDKQIQDAFEKMKKGEPTWQLN